MSPYQQLITDEILSVQGQKDYCLGAVAAGNLESWELKEYSALIAQFDQKLIELKDRLPLVAESSKNAVERNTELSSNGR